MQMSCLCNLRGHAGKHIDGYSGVHGWYVESQRNFHVARFLLGEKIM